MNFFSKYKRIFMIAGFLLIVALFAFLLFRFFFRPAAPEQLPPSGPAATSTGQLPSAGAGAGVTPGGELGTSTLPAGEAIKKADAKALGGLTEAPKVNDAPVLNSTLSKNGSGVQYYNQADGKFYYIDAAGQAVSLSDKVFYNVSNVVWASGKNKAIIEYPDQAKILYNFDTKKQITLPSHWNDFNFSADGSQIVLKSMASDPDNNWLAVANDDGSGATPIEQIGANADTVISSWSPNNQTIAMYTKGIDLNRQEVFFVGLNGENFKSTIVEGRGFDPVWSTAGDRLAYSVYSTDDDLKPRLWAVNAQGDSIGSGRQSLDIATWGSKCAFADDTTMYCGVPESLEKGAGLFPEMAAQTRDNLYQINIETGEKKLVAVPDGDFNMSDLVVTANGANLFFTDKITKTIHKVELK
jgi:hypothetical protein